MMDKDKQLEWDMEIVAPILDRLNKGDVVVFEGMRFTKGGRLIKCKGKHAKAVIVAEGTHDPTR